MRMPACLPVPFLLLALAARADVPAPQAEAPPPAGELPADIVSPELGGSLRAELKDAAGKTLASATLIEGKSGVKISVQGGKLPPGTHGFHIHEVGKCEPPDFKSAGGHFNPHGRQHGLANPQGAHGGDLPNLEVKADGSVKADFTAKGVTLLKDKPHSLLDADGSALVVHAKRDDGRTDPSGDSGDRILCGILMPASR